MNPLRHCARLLACALPAWIGAQEPPPKPNILWLTSEDHGPHMGCYGDPHARTPNIDALAAKGMRFQHVWSCAPVCAPARTTLITGMAAPSLAAEHMRSLVPIPETIRLLPQILRDAGYYGANNSKEDYNVRPNGRVWDDSSGKAHWRERRSGQPFFAVFNSGASHEGRVRSSGKTIEPSANVTPPPYHPDTPETRQTWARYYEQVRQADADAGQRLRELEEDGLTDSTIVFYFADHGPGMSRSKRSAMDSGLRVPLVVYIPPQFKHLAPTDYTAGAASERLVSFIDFAPTVLSLAGIPAPSYMQGHAFAGVHTRPAPAYVFGFRGRMDERHDLVRTVGDGRFVYVRNFILHRPHGQYVAYEFESPLTRTWHRLFQEGRLDEARARYWIVPREPEELYDLTVDPGEIHNLAEDPRHRSTLERFRTALDGHLIATRDLGFLPESEVHRRSGNRAPAEALASDRDYPIAELLKAAERAASPDEASIPDLIQSLSDPDAGIRYWGAMGLLMRGSEAVTNAHEALVARLTDESPSVRIPAAEALLRWGSESNRQNSATVLVALSDPEAHGAYVAMEALNALDAAADLLTDEHRSRLRALPVQDPRATGRIENSIARLRRHLLDPPGTR